ncbi:MAG: Rieske (2Fe-2S) protein [Myxococcota bacterium]|nr:Rieske (2Fe-2S) protein [Myxococcota bacterium]
MVLERDGIQFAKIGKVSDFSGKRFLRTTLLGKAVAVFSEGNGRFYALEMICKHQGADLTAGTMDDKTVTCPRHGWIFDLTTGACLNQDAPPLRQHAVFLEGDSIYVSFTPVPSMPSNKDP